MHVAEYSACSAVVRPLLKACPALVTSKDDVDHWGFVSVKHHSEFEALESKTVRGIRKIIPADRKGKLIFVGG